MMKRKDSKAAKSKKRYQLQQDIKKLEDKNKEDNIWKWLVCSNGRKPGTHS